MPASVKETIRKHNSAGQSKLNGSSEDPFSRVATKASAWLGSRFAFLGALVVIAAWAATGPIFRFSNTWQLIINTGTTIVTFLMVFLIQNTQNRDSKAINLKLDELIHVNELAANQMMDIESLSDEELSEIQKRYETIRAECMAREKHERPRVKVSRLRANG